MKKLAPKIASWILWIAIWGVIAFFVGSKIVLAGPIEVGQTFIDYIFKPDFWQSVATSLWHVLLGFIIAMLLGIILGYAASKNSIFKDFISPVISLFKNAPIVCFIVLLLIWFGAGYVDIITIIISSTPIFYYSIYESNESRDKNILKMFSVFCVSLKDKITTYEWPHAHTFVLQAVKNAIGIAWKSGITAQMIAVSTASIGAGIYTSKTNLDTAALIMWMICTVALSFACEKIVLLIINKITVNNNKASNSFDCVNCVQEDMNIKCKNLTIDFGNKTILNNINFEFKSGRRYAIYGEIGSGKTTLLNALMDRQNINAKYIEYTSKNLDIIQTEKTKRIFSAVFQENTLIPYISTNANISIVANKKISNKNIDALISNWDQKPSELSGGMKRCVEIVRAISAKSKIVVMDEPFSGLDETSCQIMTDYINKNLNDRTFIFVSHNKQDATNLNCEILEIKDCSLRQIN